MKNLLIIGARGFGREVFSWAKQCKEYNIEWTLKGFLDDNPSALKNFNYPIGILNSVEDYSIQKDDVFLCALGNIHAKKKYVAIINDKGGVFINLIHPLSVINDNVKIGKGVIICAFCGISNEVIIGDFVTIQGYVSIGHDCEIGNWCHLNAFTSLGGYVSIQQNVTVHTKAAILPKLNIGENAIVGAGSVVLKNVQSNVTVFGNPAKEIF
jgi:sugar O-acyltransferase (sialic acid O-acetyltransferase NeuD family)